MRPPAPARRWSPALATQRRRAAPRRCVRFFVYWPLLAECDGLIDQLLRARDFLAELLIDRRARLDERVLVHLVHLHAGSLELAQELVVVLRRGLVHVCLRFLGRVLED